MRAVRGGKGRYSDQNCRGDERSAIPPTFINSAWLEHYSALADEFAALDALLAVRKAAGLTQVEVAARMGIKPSSLARIEGSLGSHKHSPSLETLRKYARACGKRLEIRLV